MLTVYAPTTRQTRSSLCWSPEETNTDILLLQLYAFSYHHTGTGTVPVPYWHSMYPYRFRYSTGEKVDSGELDTNIVNFNDEFRRMK
jgi:hypothetical protein